MQLLRRVEHFLRSSRISPTRFGREAVRDPKFVADLRAGRTPRPATVRRVVAYLDGCEQMENDR